MFWKTFWKKTSCEKSLEDFLKKKKTSCEKSFDFGFKVEDPVNFVSSSDRYRFPSQDKFNPWTSTTTTSRSPDSSSISPPPQSSFHSTFGPRFLVQGSVSFPTATTMKGKVWRNVNISSSVEFKWYEILLNFYFYKLKFYFNISSPFNVKWDSNKRWWRRDWNDILLSHYNRRRRNIAFKYK